MVSCVPWVELADELSEEEKRKNVWEILRSYTWVGEYECVQSLTQSEGKARKCTLGSYLTLPFYFPFMFNPPK